MFRPTKIRTDRLELREFGTQDTAQVTAFLTAADRTALPPHVPRETGDLREWLTDTVHQHRLSGAGVHLVMVEHTSGEIVGSLGLRDTDWAAGRTELGYGVRTDRRGRGYATEAVRAVGRWALTAGGLRRVQLHARTGNTASLRVAEKAGYQREGTLRSAEWDNGTAHDLAVYSLITTDLTAP